MCLIVFLSYNFLFVANTCNSDQVLVLETRVSGPEPGGYNFVVDPSLQFMVVLPCALSILFFIAG